MQRGTQMIQAKKIVLTAALLVLTSPSGPGAASSNSVFKDQYKLSARMESDYDTKILQETVSCKVAGIMDDYIENAVSGISNIMEDKKNKGYIRAIQAELPRAPHRGGRTYHCLYGQYVQFNRALKENDVPTDVIPTVHNAHQSTSSFIHEMTKMYGDSNEYPGAIHRGHLYPTRSEYNRALNNYVAKKILNRSNVNKDSLRTVYTEQFNKNNFDASSLNPGSIIVVDGGHAVMYLGQGIIRNNQFVSDTNGTAIVCAYNLEHKAIKLGVWPTNHASAVDLRKIITVKLRENLRATRRQQADSVAQRYALGVVNQPLLCQRQK